MQRGSNLTNTSRAQSVTEVEDVILQILHRLPLTALGKFKSVSKRWRFLISTFCSQNPRPVRALLLQYLTGDRRYNPDLLHTAFTEPERHVSLRFDRGSPFQCLRSCNGLLLCGRNQWWDHWDYYVYNPLTRQLASLPSPVVNSSFVNSSLAYEPSVSPHYKVVCLCETRTGRKIMIYSSETCWWKRWDDSLFEPGLRVLESFSIACTVNSGVYWNGSIYYVSVEPESKLYRFDIDKEEMVVGPALPPSRGFKQLSVSASGCLYFVAGMTRKMKVYEMMNGDSEWRVKYEVDDKYDWDIKPFYCNRISIRLGGRRYTSCFEVFLWDGGENGEDGLWLVLKRSMVVLRCNLRSAGVIIVKVAPRNDDNSMVITSHDLVHSILDLPPPLFRSLECKF